MYAIGKTLAFQCNGEPTGLSDTEVEDEGCSSLG